MATRSSKTVAIAGVFHETNTFSTVHTGRQAFRNKLWAVGDELVEAFAGTKTVVGGFLDGAHACGLDAQPVFGAYATPAGPVTSDAYQEIAETLGSALRGSGPWDGMFLELHGAMVAEDDPDPERTLLASVREVAGDRPVVVVTDFHANLTLERLGLVDLLIGYRTNPHVDTHDRGVAAAGLLDALLTGRLTPTTACRRVPVLAAPIAQATSEEPLRTVLERAAALERERELIDVTVHGGYAYADVPHAGMTVLATSAVDDGRADETTEELAALAWAHRHAFAVDLPDPAGAFEQACALTGSGRPVVIADTGDNINGGSAGDGTWLLHEAIARPSVRVAATICDPEAVDAAREVGVGGVIERPVGGRSSQTSGPPIVLQAAVRWLGSGAFVQTGPMGRGSRANMGACAVLSAAGLDLLVQSLPVQPNDPALFRCAGLDPLDYDLILLKGAAALRAGWRDLTAAFVDAGTPGVTDSDLRNLPYANVSRPVWPLDE